MHVLYIHQYFSFPRYAGGTRSYEMARRLVDRGHQVTMVTSSAVLGDDFAPSPGWHSHDVDGIHVEVLRVPYSNEMSFPQRIKAFFQFALHASLHVRRFKADVVFATSTPLTIILPGLAAKLRHRIPLVFEVRDLWPEVPIAVGALRNPMAKLCARFLEWVAYRTSSHIVALSPGMAEGVTQRGIAPSKVTVIPNSCDIELFDVDGHMGAWVRSQLRISPTQPLVVYLGTFGIINNVGYLVEVASEMRSVAPSVHFLLVGGGAQLELVRTMAAAKGVLNTNLAIWPSMPKKKVPGVLAAATVATSTCVPIPAVANNSANKFFDGLAAGKPMVINYLGWQAQLLRETEAGLVIPASDPKCAALMLAEFLADEGRLMKARAQARRLAHEAFSRDRLYLKLESVLRAAIPEVAPTT